MSGKRPDLRGRGYMPKGGPKAAQAHNARERARVAAAPSPAPAVVVPTVTASDGGTDARVSASSGLSAAAARWYVVAGCVVGAVTTEALDALFGGR